MAGHYSDMDASSGVPMSWLPEATCRWTSGLSSVQEPGQHQSKQGTSQQTNVKVTDNMGTDQLTKNLLI
jgi:hypothetical protein